MKYLTLENVRDQVKNDNGWANVTSYDTRIENAISHAISEIQDEADFEWLVRDFKIATVAATEKYALPYDFRKEVEDTVAYANVKIDRLEMADVAERRDGTGAMSGNPSGYCIADVWPVMAQPSAAVTIAFVGTTNVTITVRGITSSAEAYQEVAVSTTRAATVASFTHIFSVTKLTAASGTITVYTGDTTTVIGRIPKGQVAEDYHILQADPIPDGAGTISGRYYRDMTAALQSSEAVPIPTSFERLLKKRVAMYVDYIKKDWESHRVDAAQYLRSRDKLVGRKREPSGFVHPFER